MIVKNIKLFQQIILKNACGNEISVYLCTSKRGKNERVRAANKKKIKTFFKKACTSKINAYLCTPKHERVFLERDRQIETCLFDRKSSLTLLGKKETA